MRRYYLTIIVTLLSVFISADYGYSQSLSEQAAGKKFFQLVRRQVPLVKDPLITDYIQQLGYHLVAFSNTPEQPFYFFVIKSQVINAFAGPGGYIGLFGGLITSTATESELASVLAHEIAHVSQHHLARGADKQSNLTLPALAAMVAAIAAGDAAIAMGSISAVTAGMSQFTINNTRVYETEADNIGIQTLAKAGFNPYAMVNFFKKLQANSRYDTQPPPFLLTHPVTQERMAEASARAKQLIGTRLPSSFHSSISYYLVKARMQALLAKNPSVLLQQAKSLVQQKNNHATIYSQYLLALAYLQQASKPDDQNDQQAKQILTQLLNSHPDNIILAYTLAELAYHEKDYVQASLLLKTLQQQNPDYYPILHFYGLSLLQQQDYQTALKLLQPYQTDYDTYASYWQLMSRVYAGVDNLIYAYLARAKAFECRDDYRNALLQLHMAQQQKNQTAYTRKIISARISSLEHKLTRKDSMRFNEN